MGNLCVGKVTYVSVSSLCNWAIGTHCFPETWVNSIDLGNTPPILARTNYRNCPNRVHVEKIAINADK